MSHVFLSYSHQDAAYAEKLHTELERRHYTIWRDVNLLPGDRWSAGITNALRECAALVVIMTPNSSISEWVNRELNIAERFKKPIIPLLLSGENFVLLTDIQYEDVAGGKLPSERFYKKLGGFIAAQPKSRTPQDEIEQLRLEIERLEKLVDESQQPAVQWERLETSEIEQKIRQRLIEVAKQETVISYSDLGREFGFREAHEWWRTIPGIVGRISIEESQHDRPLLSALVVNKDTYIPGDGFFKLAKALNPKYSDFDNDKILADELNTIYAYWRNHEE